MTTLADERRAQFKSDVDDLKLKTGQSRGDGAARIAGIALMVVGVVAAFVVYISSLTQSDLRDIASYQILATAFLALTVIGGALYLAGAIARVLRLWLLRQAYKEFWDGFHPPFERLKEEIVRIDGGIDRRALLDDAKMLCDELTHYYLFADLYDDLRNAGEPALDPQTSRRLGSASLRQPQSRGEKMPRPRIIELHRAAGPGT